MPSLVTGIIGGFQGASAAHHAADAQKAAYGQAGQTVRQAVGDANPLYDKAGAGVTGAASTAGAGVTGAASTAGAGVTGAAGDANGLLSPYISNGTNASDRLAKLTAAGFSFNPSDLQNDPGYQFELQQGMKGIANSTAARGMGASGAALKAAANYSTGLASTHYGDAFNRAIGTYQTNVNSLLPQAQMGMAASGAAGSNLMNAAQYAGNTGLAGAEYAGNAGMNAAQYSGNMNVAQAQNLIDAGVYQGNTQIGAGNAQAQGDIGAANSWNSMLGAIGQAGNTALMAGFGGAGSANPGGWSVGNIGTNFGNLFSAGNYGMPNNGYMPPNVDPRKG